MHRHRSPRRTGARLLLIVIAAGLLAGLGYGAYRLLPDLIGGRRLAQAETVSAVSDVNGLARLSAAGGTLDLQVSSGLSGERLAGVRVSVATAGRARLLYAEDPGGTHLPLAVPLAGEAAVRRLVMPPRPARSVNIITAVGTLDAGLLEPLGALSEEQVRARLRAGGEAGVLLYAYNPSRPLALTGAALDAYATPFANVTLLRPGVEDAGMTALVVVALGADAYDSWAHLAVDRYLAGRVGQTPAADLSADLDFAWAYPVFDIFPPEPTLDLGDGDTVTLRVRWRSQNPDPPPPWRFFVSASEGVTVSLSPETFPLGPDAPVQEVIVRIDRAGLPVGDHRVTLTIQPFSDTFGLIEQAEQRAIAFRVAEAVPTPTPGPALGDLTISPPDPREGDRLVITASGFAPGETVLVDLTGPARTLSDALPQADGSGGFRYEIDLATVPAGTYTLRLTGAQSGASAETTFAIGEGVADAVVSTGELNLRTEPRPDAPVLEILARGDELTVVAVNGDDSWLEVVSPTGVQGWVLRQWVALNIDLATVPWNPNYPAP